MAMPLISFSPHIPERPRMVNVTKPYHPYRLTSVDTPAIYTWNNSCYYHMRNEQLLIGSSVATSGALRG